MNLRAAAAFLLLGAIPMLGAPAQTVPSKPAAPAVHGFQAEFLTDLDDVQKKVLALAAAVPADKYAWRPAEGVRSISEVFMHIAGGNYFLATFTGAAIPADMPQEIEKIADKNRVQSEVEKSFAFVRSLAKNASDADLDKPITMFGKPSTERAVFTAILNHVHEHLGQSIAYARMNGVVPPWSQ
jgi:uncharacterized damage-inducible protein DinB